MNIISYFSEAGVPKTGLTPSITVITLAGDVSVNAQDMTEVAGGFYKYDFTTYDETVDYLISVDGGATLTDQDRYLASTNEVAGIGNILKIEKNKWGIVGSQLIFYDDDGTTPLYTYDLKNEMGAPSTKDVYSRNPA